MGGWNEGNGELNGTDVVAGSLPVTMEPVLGLTKSWTVYDKSPGMDFYIFHNSEGDRMGCHPTKYRAQLPAYSTNLLVTECSRHLLVCLGSFFKAAVNHPFPSSTA